MDLGVAGRAAIVCASSKGLGRACAFELARAGARVVINGRDLAVAETTAEEIRAETGADVIVVVGDLNQASVRDALFAACPEPDILVNNNGGPPPRDFEAITRDDILQGVEMGRPSRLHATATREGGKIVRATVGGQCVPVLTGAYHAP